ncbi:MAG TPA: DUF4097 family beta strand repeat-containing protein [Bryobacteraceae bacterium]|jgi:DUF4097 and DUF4098 domain-containing protein YvlB|nr:DUF4097 family beta strand repeat-containing protein [Bryobacteraceae bacterium]
MRGLYLATVMAALVGLAACDIEDVVAADSQRYREPFKFTYDLKPGGRFSLEGFNGPVEIYGWSQDKVEINGEKYASEKDKLAEIKVSVMNTPDVVSVKTTRPEWNNWHGGAGVKFIIHVPRKVILDEVKTSNGPLSIEGTEGKARLATSNGPMKIRDLKGDLDAHTSNGPLTVTGFTGSLLAATSNGPIDADGVKGFVDATTSNGPVDIRATELTSGRPVKIRTSNGPVRLTLDKLTTDVQVRSSNGPIEFRVPETGMNLSASTSSGKVRSDFPVSGETESKSELIGKIGGGGPTVDLRTSNSSIRISRY